MEVGLNWRVGTGQATEGSLRGDIEDTPSYCAFTEHQVCALTLLGDSRDIGLNNAGLDRAHRGDRSGEQIWD
jgi:hypothetical protein